MKIGRAVIISGGSLGAWALDELRGGDYVIGADRGALFLVYHGVQPDLAIGDFDSVTAGELEDIRGRSRELIACDPVDKDWTDTEMAVRTALDRGASELLLLGALGTRWDHSLANVQLLVLAHRRGAACRILDEHNAIAVTGSRLRLEAGRFTHVSLLPLTPAVTGITLTGFRYPLADAVLEMGQSLGVSNVLEEPEGIVSVAAGLLLVIQSRDSID